MNMLLADCLCRIKNASIKKQLNTIVPNSNFVRSVLYLLYILGYVTSFSIQDKRVINVFLKYNKGGAAYRGHKLISTPGKRVYVSVKTLKIYRNRNLIQKAGFLIISTSKGLMTDQEAITRNIGGELLFYIY